MGQTGIIPPIVHVRISSDIFTEVELTKGSIPWIESLRRYKHQQKAHTRDTHTEREQAWMKRYKPTFSRLVSANCKTQRRFAGLTNRLSTNSCCACEAFFLVSGNCRCKSRFGYYNTCFTVPAFMLLLEEDWYLKWYIHKQGYYRQVGISSSNCESIVWPLRDDFNIAFIGMVHMVHTLCNGVEMALTSPRGNPCFRTLCWWKSPLHIYDLGRPTGSYQPPELPEDANQTLDHI